MGKTNTDRGKYYRYAMIVLLIVFLFSSGFFLLKLWEKGQGKYPAETIDETYMEYEGNKYELKENIETFLVMGLDKYEGAASVDSYNNDMQADFLMLFVFDNDAKTCSTIHINRDTMAEMNVLGVAGNKINTVTKQIALSHTYGNGREVSCRNTADSVSKLLLDTKVDHYLSVTMDSVAVYNDLLGGVDVTVLDDFTGIDDSLIKGENITLRGEQALTYVRTRYGLEDNTNSTRMKRQHQYLNAIYEKTMELISADDKFIIESTLKMSDYIESDRSVTQIQEIMEKFSEYKFVEINEFEGESRLGEEFVEFYPDPDSVKEVVIDLFYELKD